MRSTNGTVPGDQAAAGRTLAGFCVHGLEVAGSLITKRYLANPTAGTPFTRLEALDTVRTARRYYAVLRAARVAVPETRFAAAPWAGGYAVIQRSRFLGYRNCADELYDARGSSEAQAVASALIEPWMRLECLEVPGLREDDLPIGFDNSPYNFVRGPRGGAAYVDFYPPRQRLAADGRRLADADVVTDVPAPRSAAHARHLLRCFYTRSGMWLHGLAHLLGALDSNPWLGDAWPRQERRLVEALIGRVAAAGLGHRARQLAQALSGSAFQVLRQRYREHRRAYYGRFARPVACLG